MCMRLWPKLSTTVDREILVVKIFLWGRPTAKIKWMSIYLNEHYVLVMFVGCHDP